MGRNKKRRNKVRHNEDGTSSQISKKGNERSSNSLITRRNAIGLVIAAAAIFAGRQIIGGGDEINVNKEVENSGVKHLPPKSEAQKSLSDVTQDRIVFPDSLNDIMEIIDSGYETSKEVGIVNFMNVIQSTPEMNDESPAVRQFMEEFGQTGFMGDFNALLKANEGHKKDNEILVVPFVHGSLFEEKGTPMEQKRRKGWDDVARILEIEVEGKPHKIFFEGESGTEGVYEQWQKDMKNRTGQVLTADMTAEVREKIRTDVLNLYKNSRFGQIAMNPKLNMFGLEHDKLISLIRKYKSEFRKEEHKDSGFVIGFYSCFIDAILREQYTVEKAVYNLQPGEKGVIVMGAMHVPTLTKYIGDKHPTLSKRMLIPRHLYQQEDFAM